ncbi:MAG: AAA family ATPase [Phycisphaeraceae bacterium]
MTETATTPADPTIDPAAAPAQPQAAPTAPATPPAQPGPPAETRTIALLNQKGGVGKTTTTMNLGHALARAGQRVLMVDLDPQAHLTLYNGVDPDTLDHTTYDLLVEDDVTAAETVIELDPHRGILPAHVNLAGAETELASRLVTGGAQVILRNKLRDLVKQFDYVLIDCPPSLGLLTVNALTLANEVIVPMQAHFLALQGLGKLLETIRLVSEGINPSLKVAGVVLCMHEGQTILAAEVTADVDNFLTESRGTPVPWADAVVYQPPIRRNIKLAESPSFGQSIFDYATGCPGARDYEKLALAVAQQHAGGTPS